MNRTAMKNSIPVDKYQKLLRELGIPLLAGILYFLAERLSLIFITQPERLTPIWLPSGISLAILLLLPRRQWKVMTPLFFIANVAANLLVNNSFPVTLGFAFANTLEPVVAALLMLRFCGGKVTFTRLRDVVGLVVVAAAASNFLTALVGALVPVLAYQSDYVLSWLEWWIPSGVGMLVMTPLILCWAQASQRRRFGLGAHTLETLAGLGAITFFSLYLFTTKLPEHSYLTQPVMILPILIWIAWRRGAHTVSNAIFIIAVIGILFTEAGKGTFFDISHPLRQNLLAVNLFLGICSTTALALATLVQERQAAGESYTALVENSITEIAILQGGKITFANRQLAANSGYSIDELLAMTPAQVTNMVHPEDRAYVASIMQDRLTGKSVPTQMQSRLLRKNGTTRWVETINSIISFNGKPATQVLYLDITKRKLAERDLLSSEARIASVFRAAPVGIGLLVSRTFVIVNETLCQMTGYSREELLGQSTGILYASQEEYIRIGSEVDRLLKMSGIATLESQCRRKDGSFMDALLSVTNIVYGEPALGRTFTLLDVSELKAAERSLRQSQEQYALLFSRMQDGFALLEVVRKEDGGPCDLRVLQANPAIENLTGLSVEEAIGKMAGEIIPDLDHYWIEQLCQVAETGEAGNFEQFSPSFDKWFNVEMFSPRQGQLAILFQDVTRQKKAEEAMRASLEEKTMLLKEIHHRVKNNLNMVSSLLNLQAEDAGNDEVREILDESQQRIRAIARLHEYFYRSPELGRIKMTEYVQDMVDQLTLAYGAIRGDVEIRVIVGDFQLDLDTALPCGLILNELISNALKHAFPPQKAGGHCTVDVEMRQEGERIILRVADNGVGLSPGIDPASSQSLGLHLISMLAKQIRASLSVSKEGGTEFVIAWNMEQE
jgi:PAS domain S-box-containing protein